MAETLPIVFEEDIQPILQRMQTSLESQLGRALAPGDIEMLLINSFVYELQLYRVAGNQAFRQCLTRFGTGAALEFLGELVGVKRLPASSAECTIQMNLIDGHNPVQIPQGIRVQSIDGNVTFITNSPVAVPLGVNVVTVTALCQTAGVAGNNYDPGKIAVVLDPQPYLVSAANIDKTAGGSDAETDDQLRSRINLAPSSFSVAGPKGAYIFFAKSAHPSIVDVTCVTTNPGEVTLYPLCAGGELPSDEILDKVLSTCDDEKVRPQNDTVLVDVPTVIEYAIEVELEIYTGAIDAEVLAQVNTNLNAFKDERNNKLGMDVIRSQISALSMVKDQVYDVTIVSPVADIVADEKTYPKCTGINVTITGSNNG
ncbi:baseplate assembly protein [Pinibacter soli]|uniref:Baseplate J/gp47 family protein n=1 Tax=Pinibacter soli TaxID=3044211 RepID=A0ABT6RBR4_9BACT|nr:baseplate J/gp47 family protein [Pinibacter soli]MDI3319999.1 baseplate J/gp47 family protein [Pinibacter soli]